LWPEIAEPNVFPLFFGGQRLLKTRGVFLPTFLWAEMAKSQFFSFHAFDLPIGGPWTFLSRLLYIAFQDREFDGFHITYTIHSVFLDILKIQALDLQFASWAAGHRPPQNEGSWAFGLPCCQRAPQLRPIGNTCPEVREVVIGPDTVKTGAPCKSTSKPIHRLEALL